MNVISNMPRWAQAPTQSFAKNEKIAGTQTQKMDQDSFQSTLEAAAGIVTLVSNDEVEGVDEAMGQPGVVVSQGVTIKYVGDPSNSEGSVEAAVSAQEGDAEIAMYVTSSPKGFSALQLAKAGDQIQLQGGAAKQGFLGLSGYVIAGELPA